MSSAVGQALHSYVALGDSFTAGTGCRRGERWADLLADRLAAGSSDFVYRNLAIEGATSKQVLDQLDPALRLEPDLVTVVCGANDVLLSVRPDPAAYRRRLRVMLRVLSTGLPQVRIATATAPEGWSFLDLGPRTRARVERGIAEFNVITRTVAAEFEVPCLEVAGHPGLDEPENFVDDGLHPSATGHHQAAEGFAGLLGLEGSS
jgi:lysophospholipase L1-like esterase